jgi:Sjoegren syndrome nuclear autoantigen 1
MASLGADLQVTNNELVSIIEELKDRRGQLDRAIQKEEDERLQIAVQIQELSSRLQAVDQSLQLKYAARKDFDETIQSTAVSFANILDSSRILLSTVKRDSISLTSKSMELSQQPREATLPTQNRPPRP